MIRLIQSLSKLMQKGYHKKSTMEILLIPPGKNSAVRVVSQHSGCIFHFSFLHGRGKILSFFFHVDDAHQVNHYSTGILDEEGMKEHHQQEFSTSDLVHVCCGSTE